VQGSTLAVTVATVATVAANPATNAPATIVVVAAAAARRLLDVHHEEEVQAAGVMPLEEEEVRCATLTAAPLRLAVAVAAVRDIIAAAARSGMPPAWCLLRQRQPMRALQRR